MRVGAWEERWIRGARTLSPLVGAASFFSNPAKTPPWPSPLLFVTGYDLTLSSSLATHSTLTASLVRPPFSTVGLEDSCGIPYVTAVIISTFAFFVRVMKGTYAAGQVSCRWVILVTYVECGRLTRYHT